MHNQNFKLNDFVFKFMPHFISMQYEKLLKSESPKKKVMCAVQLYEQIIRTLAINLISQYLKYKNDQFKHREINELLLEKLPFGTLNNWNEIFFKMLKAYEGGRDLFFMPELYDFYWDIYLNGPDVPKHSNPEFHFEQITQICNDIDQKRLPKDEAEWEEVCLKAVNSLENIFRKLMFFENYELIYIKERIENKNIYEKYTGLDLSNNLNSVNSLENLGVGWFFCSKRNNKFLNLHPLLIFWEKSMSETNPSPNFDRSIALFERQHKAQNRISYRTADLWNIVFSEEFSSHYRKNIEVTITLVKSEPKEFKYLTWMEFSQRCSEITKNRIASVVGKYNKDLYLQRDECHEIFSDFIESDATGFVLLGKSGVGKSNFFLSLIDEFNNGKFDDKCFLMYNGAKINANEMLSYTIGKDFLLTDRTGEIVTANLWEEIDRIEGINNRRLILIIDAINENENPELLLRQIDKIVEDSSWSWLKIVIVSRPEVWRHVKRKLHLAETKYFKNKNSEDFELKLFTRSELPKVYDRYKAVFKLKTEFNTLNSEIKLALSDPLKLRLISKMHKDNYIKPDIKVNEIYKKYIDYLIETKRLEIVDVVFLEKELVLLMVREDFFTNAISDSDIDEKTTTDGKALFDLINNYGILTNQRRINQSFINLIETEILVRYGKGLEYDIRFKYERLYDYFVGKYIYEKISNKYRKDEFETLIGKISENPFLWGAIKTALILKLKSRDMNLVIDLCHTDLQLVKEMMTSSLIEYGTNDADLVKLILEKLLEVKFKDKVLVYIKSHPMKIFFNMISQDPKKDKFNAKKITLEVAKNLGLYEILINGALDFSATIRTHAVKHSINLWRNDKYLDGKNANDNKGIKILKALLLKIRDGNRLNLNAAEAVIGMFVSISLESNYLNNIEKFGYKKILNSVSKKGLKDLLFISEDCKKDRFPKNLIREFVLKKLIKKVVSWIHHSPEHNTFSFPNVTTFFDLNKNDRSLLKKILPLYNPEQKGIKELKRYIPKVCAINDTIINWVLWLVLLAQWDNNKEDVLEIVSMLFNERTGNDLPKYANTVSISVLAGVLRQGRGDKKIMEKFLEYYTKILDVSGGKVIFSGGIYVRSIFDIFFDAMFGFCNKIDTSIPGLYVKKAVEENEIKFLNSAIYYLGIMIADKRYHGAILSVISHLISCENEKINDDVINLLARIRVNSMDKVDDFMLENEFSYEKQRYVKNREIKETIGGDILFVPMYRFIADASVNSRDAQKFLQWIFNNAIHCKNINDFILAGSKKLFNQMYGDEIFKLEPKIEKGENK